MRCTVAAPHAIDQSCANLAKQRIAGVMSKRIVYTLEVVQVEKQNGQDALVSPGAVNRKSHEFLQEAAVRQPGHGVEVGEITDPFLRHPVFRDVLSDSGDLANAAGRVRLHLDFLMDEAARAILPDDPMFEVARRPSLSMREKLLCVFPSSCPAAAFGKNPDKPIESHLAASPVSYTYCRISMRSCFSGHTPNDPPLLFFARSRVVSRCLEAVGRCVRSPRFSRRGSCV